MSREKDIDMGGGVLARPGRRRKHLKPYTTLYESNFRDVPKTLRKIAKQLETGELAMANEAALVLDCADGTFKVFGFGPHYASIAGTTVLLELGAGELYNAMWTAKELQRMFSGEPKDD